MINLNRVLKVLYVHGFRGHENGESARLLRKTLEDRGIKAIVDAPSIPYMEPLKTVVFISSIHNYDLIVASSLGAFYSLNNKGICKILVNIAMPSDLLKVEPDLDMNYINMLNKIKTDFFNNGGPSRIKYETIFIFGTKDNIAENKDLIIDNFYCFNDNNIKMVEMSHHLDEAGVNKICDTIFELSLSGNRNLQTYEELPPYEEN